MDYTNDAGMVIPPFNEVTAKTLAEELMNEEKHRHARQILMVWVQKENFNDSNASLFFTLMESCLCYQQKLKLEKKKLEKLIEENLSKNPVGPNIQNDLTLIEKVFNVIRKQDIWESFTPSQKVNIQMMKLDLLDLSENTASNYSSNKNIEKGSTNFKSDAYELNMLIFNLKNKLNMICKEAKVLEAKYKENEKEISNLKLELQSRKQESPVEAATRCNEMQILSLTTIVLFQNPSGLNIDNIYYELNKNIPNTNTKEIDFVLRKFPHLFKEAGFENDKKWLYIGLRI